MLSVQCVHPEKSYPTSFVYPEEVREAAQIMRNEIEKLKADVAELVECLGRAFADPQRLISNFTAMDETAALLTKHAATRLHQPTGAADVAAPERNNQCSEY
jgi:hypothetical protein